MFEQCRSHFILFFPRIISNSSQHRCVQKCLPSVHGCSFPIDCFSGPGPFGIVLRLKPHQFLDSMGSHSPLPSLIAHIGTLPSPTLERNREKHGGVSGVSQSEHKYEIKSQGLRSRWKLLHRGLYKISRPCDDISAKKKATTLV